MDSASLAVVYTKQSSNIFRRSARIEKAPDEPRLFQWARRLVIIKCASIAKAIFSGQARKTQTADVAVLALAS